MPRHTEYKIKASQSKIHRIQQQAAVAYLAGKPYTAYQILKDADLAILWPTFLRTAKTWAGERYRREMARQSR